MLNNDKFTINLEDYEKIRVVGKGAFGTAILYKRLSDKMHVVMKEVYLTDMTKDERNMALNEVNVLSSLNHPNIIRYIGSFLKQDALTIIMEYANAGNLSQLIKQKKEKKENFTERSILQIFYQISSALNYMHSSKILHRDLKSANIFLNKNGSVKVGDFGISKILHTKSQAQTVVGTPYYLSPEICEGKEYDEKSDIWALGCILYELACLRKPFEATSLPILVQKISNCEYENIPGMYSEELANVVRLILQKNTEKRPNAQSLCETIIPDICRNLDNLSGLSRRFSLSMQMNSSSERSVLYFLNTNDETAYLSPIELPSKKIIDFSASKTHYTVVTADKMVYTWGHDDFGQLAHGQTALYRKYPICVDYLRGKNVIKAVSGSGFTLFLNENGLVMSCGDGRQGCLGHGDWNCVTRPKLIDRLITCNIVQIACGTHHVIALSSNRKLYTWGLSEDGQLGLDNRQFSCTPTELKYISKSTIIEKIFAGENASAFLTAKGKLYICGSNCYNKLGIRDKEKITVFTLSNEIQEKIIEVSLGVHHTVLLAESGNIIAMGRNSEGQLGKGNSKVYISPQTINILKSDIDMVSCGKSYTLVATSNNIIYIWGTYYKEGEKKQEADKLPCNKKHLNENENNKQFSELFLQPKSILILYSSPENVKSGNMVWLGGLKTNCDDIMILVHTTTPLCLNSNGLNTLNNKSTTFLPYWKNTSGSLQFDDTTLPNTPHMH